MSKNYTNYNKPNSANKQNNEQSTQPVDPVTPVTPDTNEGQPTQPVDPVTPDTNEGQPTQPVDPVTPDTNEDDQTTDPEPDGIVPIIGVVTNCKILNVRADTNKEAEIITIIKAGTEVVVRPLDGNDEWLEVHSREGEPGSIGFHGFCMKNFITIK